MYSMVGDKHEIHNIMLVYWLQYNSNIDIGGIVCKEVLVVVIFYLCFL